MKVHIDKNSLIEKIICVIGVVICILVYLNSKWLLRLDGDNAPQTYAAYAQVAKSIFEGEIPLWNPFIWGGIPQMGSPISEGFYPINWLLCILCYDQSAAMLSYSIIPCNIAIHIVIYYVGMILILNRIIRLNMIQSSAVAILSVLSISFLRFLEWIVYFNGFAWFPLIIYLTYQVLENTEKRKRHIFILGCAFGMEALISVSVALVVTVFFCACLLIQFCVSKKKFWEYAFSILKAGMIGVFISLPALISTVVYLINSVRYVPDIGFMGFGEKIPVDLFNVHKCELVDVISMFKIIPTYSFLSTSILLIVLVVIALFKQQNDIFSKWIKFCTVFSFFYCIGIVIPEIAYYIPLLNYLREPFMYACFLNFFLTLLAGCGLKEYNNCIQKNERLDYKINIIIIIIAIFNLLPQINTGGFTSLVAVLFILAVVFVFIKIKKEYKIVIYHLISSFMMILVVFLFVRFVQYGIYTEKAAIEKVNVVNLENRNELDKLGNLEKTDRIIAWSEVQCLPQNQGAAIGIKETVGYYNPLPQSNEMIHNRIDLYKRCQLQGIKYILINAQSSGAFMDYISNTYPMFHKETDLDLYTSYEATEKSNIYIYEFEEAVSGWGVTDIVVDMGTDKNIEWINNYENNLYTSALVSKKELTNEHLTANKIEVDVSDVNNNSIKYKTNSNGSFLLVTTQIYFPGWEVYVNGEKQEMIIVDEVNCGVVVDAGYNDVELVYAPTYISMLVLFQVLMLLAGLGIVCIMRVRNKKNFKIEKL